MKRMNWVLVVLIGLFAMAAGAVTLDGPLSISEQAASGANWIVKITHADLTQTNLNDTQTLTSFGVNTNVGVEVKAVVLKTAFEDTATNAHNSTTLTVGDGDDADRFITSQQLNVNGSEVYLKFARETTGALTASTVTYTNVVHNGGALTGNISTVTYSLADTEFGRKVYTGVDTVDFCFTSMAGYSLADLDAGEVWIYLKVTEGK